MERDDKIWKNSAWGRYKQTADSTTLQEEKREDRSGSQKRKTHKKPNQMTKITTFLAIDLTSSVDDTNNFTKKNENHIHKINETNIIRHSRYFEVNQYCHFQDNSRRSNTLVTLSMAQIWRRLNFDFTEKCLKEKTFFPLLKIL